MSNIITSPYKPPLGTQMNHGHPLAQGLVGCWPMNEGAGGVVYDASGNDNHGTLAGNTTWGDSNRGRTLRGTGNNCTVEFAKPFTSAGPFTIVTWAQRTETRSIHLIIASSGAQMYWDNNDTRFTVSWLHEGGRSYQNPITGAVFDSNWACYVIVARPTFQEFYFNGALVSGTTSTLVDNTLDRIGSTHATRCLLGFWGITSAYNRALSAAEVASIYADPYGMFRPEPIELWGAVAVEDEPGAIELSGRSSTPTRAEAQIDTAVSLSGESRTGTRAGADISTAIQIAGVSQTGSRAEADIDTEIEISGASRTPTRAGAEIDTSIALAGASRTSSRGNAEIDTDVSLAGKSQTATRAEGELDTTIQLSGASRTPTRATAEIAIADVTELSGRSATPTRATAEVDTSVALAGDTRTQTRAEADIDVEVSLVGRSQTDTRAQAGLDTRIELSGVSRTPTRATAEIQVTDQISLSCVSRTSTRAEAQIHTPVSLSGVSQSATRASLDISTVIQVGAIAAVATRATCEINTLVSLSGRSYTSTRGLLWPAEITAAAAAFFVLKQKR